MDESETKSKRKRSVRDLWRLVLVVIGVIAVAQQLQRPPDKRTWHGKVADVIPYDFRLPTADRFRETYWNPDGPILTGKVWGVGWAINAGAVKKLIGL